MISAIGAPYSRRAIACARCAMENLSGAGAALFGVDADLLGVEVDLFGADADFFGVGEAIRMLLPKVLNSDPIKNVS